MSETETPSRYGRIRGLLDLSALESKRVTLLGQGSMGQPVGAQLVRHGVATKAPARIRLIDGDRVEDRNIVGTDYRTGHIGMPKVEAAASILREIDPRVTVTFWDRTLTEQDVTAVVDMARRSDLQCLFLDSFGLAMTIANRCHDIRPQVMSVFGPRCDYAEVGLSVPGQTVPLSATMGRQERRAIAQPEALGCDTIFVASFVAMVCLRLLVSGKAGEDLLACFADAPLYVVGLRPSWVFSRQPPGVIRSIHRVHVPTNLRSLGPKERKGGS